MSTNTTAGKKVISQIKDVSGLLECTMNHTVSETTASFKLTTPKMSRDEWNKMLAFFRWTYNEHKSESQVRLFVNIVTREWKIWAFPQKARTGMTATELDTEDTKLQRAQFRDSDGWVYFGTVHHHCAAGAFQSGTDASNEKDQDGIHITVGNLNSDHYDIHYRMYLGGFEMQMAKPSDFWDVEPEISMLPLRIQFMIKKNLELLVKDQMGTPPPADFPFPDQWKTNVIEEVTQAVTTIGANTSWAWNETGHMHTTARKFWRNRTSPVYDTDKKKAIRHMKALIFAMPPQQALSLEECVLNLQVFMNGADDDVMELLDIMLSCDLTVEGMELAVLEYRQAEKMASESIQTTGGKRVKKGTKLLTFPESAEEERQRTLSESEGWQHLGNGNYGHYGH